MNTFQCAVSDIISTKTKTGTKNKILVFHHQDTDKPKAQIHRRSRVCLLSLLETKGCLFLVTQLSHFPILRQKNYPYWVIMYVKNREGVFNTHQVFIVLCSSSFLLPSISPEKLHIYNWDRICDFHLVF